MIATLRSLTRLPALLWRAYQHYSANQGVRMAAALAYYGLFAVVPLIVIVSYIASLVVGPDLAGVALNEQLSVFLPQRVAAAVAKMQAGVLSVQSSSVAPIVSAVLLVYGATTGMAEIRAALNVLWDAPADGRHAVFAVVKERALSLLGVLAIAVLLLASIVASTGLAVAEQHLVPAWDTLSDGLGETVTLSRTLGDFGLSATRQALDLAQLTTTVYGLSATLVLVLLVYVVLADVRQPAGATFAGALLTTVLLWVGQWLLALYFAHSARLSAFGAATTVVVILVWAYFSAQILYFGAAFAYVIANPPAPAPAPDAGELDSAENGA